MGQRKKTSALTAESIESQILKDRNRKATKKKLLRKKKTEQRKRMPSLRKLKPGHSPVAIERLPEISGYETPPFESYSGRRGVLLRLGVGSAYVETEREPNSPLRERYYISRQSLVTPLVGLSNSRAKKR